MNRAEKQEIVSSIVEKVKENGAFYITDASGLTVAEVNQLRGMCFEKDVEYKVYKNTLIAKALEQIDPEVYNEEFSSKVLKGFSGVMFVKESAKEPAAVIKKFRKDGAEKPLLKVASIESSLYYGEENLDVLAKLKSKDELIGDVIGLLQSPAKNVISALSSGGNKLSGILKTLSEKEG